MHILHVVGARPNFMKAAPLVAALRSLSHVHQTLVHTGQHYDAVMSDTFFAALGLPEPDVHLSVGSGGHAQQTALVMQRFDGCIAERLPDLVVVYGDVNSTMAAALVAVKRLVPVAHVEAGLRSGDLTMPEEINRLVTDRVSSHLYTPSPDGDENLLAEGVDVRAIHRVGNIMIDSLMKLLPTATARAVLERLGLIDNAAQRPFILVTLHRPSNVDDSTHLSRLLEVLVDLAKRLPVVFPVHPRTRPHLDVNALTAARVFVLDPLSYPEFIDLERRATLVITDSGGVQEETTFLGVPCLTVRDNTERPVTVTEGTNVLVGRDPALLRVHAGAVLDGERKQGCVPALWDGQTAERITNHIASLA